MHLGLKGKVVMVTGGTKGIGLAIVRAFLDERATVHFCSRTQNDVTATQKALTEAYPSASCHGNVVDISNASSLKDWVSTVGETFGIDVLVANVSAVAIPNTAENWAASFQTDMLGTYQMIETALPWLERRKGNAIAIASVTGRDIDFSAPSPYGAMKAAVIHYMAQLAHTLAPKGIRANCVSPGNTFVDGGVWDGIKQNQPEVYEKQLALNPTGRFAKPEEIANAVVFLASEKASFISGANLNVDGALCTGVQF